MEILIWSHNMWHSSLYAAVPHPCPDVWGLSLQCYMAWIGNRNLCICRVLKKPTKFSYLSPSCTAELSLKKIQRQSWAEIPWEFSAHGLEWGRPVGEKKEKRKNKIPFKVYLSWGNVGFQEQHISQLFIQQGNSALSVLLNEIPLLLGSTWK